MADEGAVPVAAIVGELGGAEVAASGAASVDGYAVSGDSVRGAIEALMLIEPMGARDDGAVLRLDAAGAAPVTIAAGDLGANGGERRMVRREEAAQGAGKLPDEISITYYEPDRDWQAGLQRARRRGGAVRTDARELPAAMAAGQAKAIAERELGRVWTERRGLKVMLPWRYLDLRPGMAVWSLADALWVYRVDDDWAIGELPVAKVIIGGNPVLGARRPAISDPAGGATIDVQARNAIVGLLDAARAHGLISA
ncbi:phage tail protein [Sphingomonas crocodyli]|uniref:Tip attachment protein J domain-containing protein n=1 Tax=Sphingomonas crocodyli TaxID=1979270 RepID=A0A437M6R3_9SPHN|nr:phage tail protein [Sphingomonas crocodyli]RVT93400.1 hypothetical protein EOD43_05855 [Sphingomonas crocodyli]